MNTTAITAPVQPMTLRLVRGRNRRPLREMPVATVNEASALFSRYIWRGGNPMGSSAAPTALLIVGGEVRGHVSYNGKVWEGDPRDWKPGMVPVFDPFAEAK